VDPRAQPVGADLRGGVAELPEQDGAALVIEAVVVFVGVIVQPAARPSVGQQDVLDPTVRAQ